MEPDEIGVVLSRASELHSKISDALDRTRKVSEFVSVAAAGERGPYVENLSPALDYVGGYGGVSRDSYGRYQEHQPDDGGGYDTGTTDDGSAEARSLGSIRDALEVLEEQLESLQVVQMQQRTEKDSALAELEESRRILLRRLKDHRGREWAVVHEALAFAGEPVEERDDLPLPPYPRPLSAPPFEGKDATPCNGLVTQKYNGAMAILSLGPRQDNCFGEADGCEEGNNRREEEQEGTSFRVEGRRKEGGGGGLLGMPVSFAKAVFGHVCGLATNATLVVVSVAAALAVSELRQRQESKQSYTPFAPKRPVSPPPIATARQLPPLKECSPGKKLIIEDGQSKCVVKERVELPFHREIRTPDVLYGRG